MIKFKVFIDRTETYHESVQVEAATPEDARRIAEENYRNGEYDLKFGCPQSVSEIFSVQLNPVEGGKYIDGAWYTNEMIEEYIKQIESKPVTGYLLELNYNGEGFRPCEFATACESNRHENRYDGKAESEDWWADEVFSGYFAEFPTAFLDDGTSWGDRCGVDFDPRTTPFEKVSPNGVWEGDCTDGAYDKPCKWRVRAMTISGKLSEKARAYFRKHPNIWVRHEAK